MINPNKLVESFQSVTLVGLDEPIVKVRGDSPKWVTRLDKTKWSS